MYIIGSSFKSGLDAGGAQGMKACWILLSHPRCLQLSSSYWTITHMKERLQLHLWLLIFGFSSKVCCTQS